ncbi:MAG: DDE-type integrase/transposase/recombinase [Lachnospiraceae bacterium]|nr:DDE-type integrase/transposase/recombinase [Lachnospiraceae bacterium]
MDLFSRKIIPCQLSGKADADLVATTFQKACRKRNAPYGLMFHSDRGSQYAALSFRQLLDSYHVVQSFFQFYLTLSKMTSQVRLRK